MYQCSSLDACRVYVKYMNGGDSEGIRKMGCAGGN